MLVISTGSHDHLGSDQGGCLPGGLSGSSARQAGLLVGRQLLLGAYWGDLEGPLRGGRRVSVSAQPLGPVLAPLQQLPLVQLLPPSHLIRHGANGFQIAPGDISPDHHLRPKPKEYQDCKNWNGL